MHWLLILTMVALWIEETSATVRCECMAKAMDSNGTSAAFTMSIDSYFGRSPSCGHCKRKCQVEINRLTKNGDLRYVPMSLFNTERLGSLICKKAETDMESTTVKLYAVCNDGEPKLCKFTVRNPSYICCRNQTWPDVVKNEEKCPQLPEN